MKQFFFFFFFFFHFLFLFLFFSVLSLLLLFLHVDCRTRKNISYDITTHFEETTPSMFLFSTQLNIFSGKKSNKKESTRHNQLCFLSYINYLEGEKIKNYTQTLGGRQRQRRETTNVSSGSLCCNNHLFSLVILFLSILAEIKILSASFPKRKRQFLKH